MCCIVLYVLHVLYALHVCSHNTFIINSHDKPSSIVLGRYPTNFVQKRVKS